MTECAKPFQELLAKAAEKFPNRCADMDIIDADDGVETVRCYAILDRPPYKKALGSVCINRNLPTETTLH